MSEEKNRVNIVSPSPLLESPEPDNSDDIVRFAFEPARDQNESLNERNNKDLEVIKSRCPSSSRAMPYPEDCVLGLICDNFYVPLRLHLDFSRFDSRWLNDEDEEHETEEGDDEDDDDDDEKCCTPDDGQIDDDSNGNKNWSCTQRDSLNSIQQLILKNTNFEEADKFLCEGETMICDDCIENKIDNSTYTTIWRNFNGPKEASSNFPDNKSDIDTDDEFQRWMAVKGEHDESFPDKVDLLKSIASNSTIQSSDEQISSARSSSNRSKALSAESYPSAPSSASTSESDCSSLNTRISSSANSSRVVNVESIQDQLSKISLSSACSSSGSSSPASGKSFARYGEKCTGESGEIFLLVHGNEDQENNKSDFIHNEKEMLNSTENQINIQQERSEIIISIPRADDPEDKILTSPNAKISETPNKIEISEIINNEVNDKNENKDNKDDFINDECNLYPEEINSTSVLTFSYTESSPYSRMSASTDIDIYRNTDESNEASGRSNVNDLTYSDNSDIDQSSDLEDDPIILYGFQDSLPVEMEYGDVNVIRAYSVKNNRMTENQTIKEDSEKDLSHLPPISTSFCDRQQFIKNEAYLRTLSKQMLNETCDNRGNEDVSQNGEDNPMKISMKNERTSYRFTVRESSTKISLDAATSTENIQSHSDDKRLNKSVTKYKESNSSIKSNISNLSQKKGMKFESTENRSNRKVEEINSKCRRNINDTELGYDDGHMSDIPESDASDPQHDSHKVFDRAEMRCEQYGRKKPYLPEVKNRGLPAVKIPEQLQRRRKALLKQQQDVMEEEQRLQKQLKQVKAKSAMLAASNVTKIINSEASSVTDKLKGDTSRQYPASRRRLALLPTGRHLPSSYPRPGGLNLVRQARPRRLHPLLDARKSYSPQDRDIVRHRGQFNTFNTRVSRNFDGSKLKPF